MKVAGFSIIRNAVKFDYPVVEAITSILPICDAFYISVGQSDDGTKALIQSINSPKLVIIDTIWDDALREGGKVLAVETNKVFDAIPAEYDWCFYIQSDEVVHERYLPVIKEAMQRYRENSDVQGLLFRYTHFYGHYSYVGGGRNWYRNEIRVIRNDKTIRSYKDAQGFRTTDNQKLKVKPVDAFIYHYGWVKSPKFLQAKEQHFHKMWHDDEWMKKNIPEIEEFDYSNINILHLFKETHPEVMQKRIEAARWTFKYDERKIKRSLKDRVLFWIEQRTGWRVGENKNYTIT
ncbi:MAG: glycosyltransferase family 2 protein [Sediminibacterium sp.]|nr:glycosyltransferase family 2 protein [Sediminibacterium sp.]